MITNSTPVTSTGKMSNREILASKLSKIVATNKQSVEQVEPNSWKFKGIEVDSKVNDYMVKLTPKVGKSGKTFKKRELYRIVDGAEQKVELGEFKKAYLYKIVRGLTTTKTPRAHLTTCDFSVIQGMRDYIKTHKDEFTFDGSVLAGKVPQGEFKLVEGHIKPMKNDHKRVFGRQLFINGKLFAEGGALIHLVKAFNAKKRGKKAKVQA